MSRPTTPLHPPASSTLYPLPSGPPSIPKSSIEPFSTPPRSNTHHHHKSSRPHIPHQAHRVHRHHHTDPSQQVPQSAITGPSHSPFGDFLTKTKSSLADPFPTSTSALVVGLGGRRTPPRTGDAAITATSTAGPLDASAGGNERDTNNQAKEDGDEEREKRRRQREAADRIQQQQQQQRQKWTTVTTLRRQRAEAEEDLHATLAQLSTLSTATTRRLDYTYYALLSSLAGLRAGIGSLHALAGETHLLGDKFRAQTRDVRVETEGLVAGAEEQFRRQAGRIGGLEGRLRGGREKVLGLSERLEAVRRRVEAAAERDGEGRRRVKGFWRMGWGCMAILGVVVLVGWAWQRGGVEDLMIGVGGGDGNGSFWEMPMREGTLGADDLKTGLQGLRGPDVGNETLRKQGVDGGVGVEQSKGKVDAEATLRLFDEL